MANLRKQLLVGGAVAGMVAIGVIPLLTGGASAGTKRAQAVLYNVDGDLVGTVNFEKVGGTVKVRISVTSVEPAGKFHGIHVHAVGQCDADATDASGNPSPFFTAGGHYNPGGVGHGDHAADFPPLLVMADGTQKTRFFTDRFTVNDLLDDDGSAVILHAGLDNLANIPTRYHSHTPDETSTTFGPDTTTLATGDAGARFACGLVDPIVG